MYICCGVINNLWIESDFLMVRSAVCLPGCGVYERAGVRTDRCRHPCQRWIGGGRSDSRAIVRGGRVFAQVSRALFVHVGTPRPFLHNNATIIANFSPSNQSMGLGGGFLMTIWDARTKTADYLDARETAPSGAHENMFGGDAKLAMYGVWLFFCKINIATYS